MSVDVVRGNDLEAHLDVVLYVPGSLNLVQLTEARSLCKTQAHGELAANASVHTGVRHEVLLMGKIKERSVRNPRLLRGSARVCRPCIEVSIEVNHRNWAINLVEGTENG